MNKQTLTQRIFEENGCPYNNPYQGTSPRLLFVCSAGLLRSPTAANIAARSGFNTRSCGSSSYALIGLSANLIKWADKIIFVNPANELEAINTFRVDTFYFKMLKEKSICWNIEDDFDYMHPQLVMQIENALLDLQI